jgi:hypothetical protein
VGGHFQNVNPKDKFNNRENENHQLSLGKFNEYVNDGNINITDVRNQELDNMLVRKQLWAKENPEKFYQGKIDADWQKDKIKKGI